MKKANSKFLDPEEMLRNWNRPFVVRDRVDLHAATGGAVHPRTMANLDCLGKGPDGRFRVGRKVLYPADKFFAWFAARAKPCIKRDERRVSNGD